MTKSLPSPDARVVWQAKLDLSWWRSRPPLAVVEDELVAATVAPAAGSPDLRAGATEEELQGAWRRASGPAPAGLGHRFREKSGSATGCAGLG